MMVSFTLLNSFTSKTASHELGTHSMGASELNHTLIFFFGFLDFFHLPASGTILISTSPSITSAQAMDNLPSQALSFSKYLPSTDSQRVLAS